MTTKNIKRNMNRAIRENKYFVIAEVKVDENGRLEIVPYVSFPKGINHKKVYEQLNNHNFLKSKYTINKINILHHQLYDCKTIFMIADSSRLTEYTFEIIDKNKKGVL